MAQFMDSYMLSSAVPSPVLRRLSNARRFRVLSTLPPPTSPRKKSKNSQVEISPDLRFRAGWPAVSGARDVERGEGAASAGAARRAGAAGAGPGRTRPATSRPPRQACSSAAASTPGDRGRSAPAESEGKSSCGEVVVPSERGCGGCDWPSPAGGAFSSAGGRRCAGRFAGWELVGFALGARGAVKAGRPRFLSGGAQLRFCPAPAIVRSAVLEEVLSSNC